MLQRTDATVRRLPTLHYSEPCLTSNLIQVSIALDSATVASTNERTCHGPLSSAIVKAELLSLGEQSSALAVMSDGLDGHTPGLLEGSHARRLGKQKAGRRSVPAGATYFVQLQH